MIGQWSYEYRIGFNGLSITISTEKPGHHFPNRQVDHHF